MVKNTLFLMSHIGSGWEKLCNFLEQDSRFHCFQTGNSYRHPDDIKQLTSLPHRHDDALAIWVDVLLHNESFTMKRLCPYYNFIYWSSKFEEAKEVLEKEYALPQQYYNFRIAGMKQYFARSKSALWNPVLQKDLFFSASLG